MQFSTALLALTTAASTVTACYGSSDASGHYGAWLKENDILDSVCRYFEGTYREKEERYKCIQGPDGVKWDFFLWRVSKSSGYRNIDVTECLDGMRKEAYDCEYGGKSSYGNWGYRADPNFGYCYTIN